MKTCHILFFCFLSALWDENTGVSVFQIPEGRNFTVLWKFSSCASRRFFCRRECEGGDVLVDTADNRTQSGRYGVECKSAEPAGGFMSVTITQLIQSDSGRYRFGLGRSLVPDVYGELEVRVLDEINIHSGAEGGQVTVFCHYSFSNSRKFFCKGECKDGNILLETTGDRAQSGRYSITYSEESSINTFFLRVSITDLNKSDSGRYSCGLGETWSSASFQKFEISVADAPVTKPVRSPTVLSRSTSGSSSSASPEITNQCRGFLWPLALCVPVIVLLLAVVLLLLYKLKANRNTEDRNKEVVTYENQPPVPTHEASIYQSLVPVPESGGRDKSYHTVKHT